MRILFISQYFHPEQVSNNRMAQHLAERGNDVTVYAAVPNYPRGVFFDGYSNRSKRRERWGKVDVWRAWTIARGRSSIRLLANYLAFPVSAGWRVLARSERPDVVFVSQLSPVFMLLPGILQKWKTGCGLVYWVQDIWPESVTYTLGLRNRVLTGVLSWLCGWMYRRADIVMIQSPAFLDMLTRFGVAEDRIRILYNTAPEGYRPLTPGEAPEFGALVPQEGFRLMFAGNIGESQDFDTLVAAAVLLRERRDLHWVIVGSGRAEERVKALVAQNGLEDQFHFLGRHPEDAMPKLFAHADAMLVSLRDIPIFALTVPYKVQCYMACGKPIVGSLDGEGARIINEAGAGRAVGAARPEALAEAIAGIMDSDSDRRAAFAEKSRAYFEANFAAEKVFGDLEHALQDARAG